VDSSYRLLKILIIQNGYRLKSHKIVYENDGFYTRAEDYFVSLEI